MKKNIFATASLLLTAVIWGLSYSAQAEAMKTMSALFFVFLRYLIGSAMLLKKRDVVVMSNWSGKAATVLLVLAVVAIFPWHAVEAVRTAGYVLLYAGLAVSLYSMVNYGLLYVKNGNGPKAH